MEWLLEILKGILKIDKLDGKISLNLFSNNKIEKKYEITKNILSINYASLDEKEVAEIKRAFDQSLKNGIPIVESQSAALLDKLEVSYESVEQKMNVYKDIVPSRDIAPLRASLYLREQHESHNDVSLLKHDIICRYGIRGNNIANLCTAGYFEDIIKPLFDEMSKEDNFDKNAFNDAYDLIVDSCLLAIFVNSRKNFEDHKSRVLAKIKANKRYGINWLKIHGIGEGNVKTVFKLLNDSDIIKAIKSQPQINSGKGFIIAKIEFKEK